jgi:hypothetical protein
MHAEVGKPQHLLNLKWLISQTALFSRRLIAESDGEGCPEYLRSMVRLHQEFLLSHERLSKTALSRLDDETYACCPHEWTSDWFDQEGCLSPKVTYCRYCELEKRT